MLRIFRRALDNFFDDKRITISVLCVWFIVCMVLFAYLGFFNTSYMAIGPNSKLIYMGMLLDTWNRYLTVLVFVIVSTAMNDIAGDAISPWMANSICDHKNRYIPYSKSTCLLISQLWAIYCAVMSIASISLVFSQFDLLAVRLLVDLMVNQYTTSRFLQNKTHSPSEYSRWFELVPEESGNFEIGEEVDDGSSVQYAGGVVKKKTHLGASRVEMRSTPEDESETLLDVVVKPETVHVQTPRPQK
jgi:hypothetical protein